MFTQLAPEEYDARGKRNVAIIYLSVDELRERGLRFFDDYDDLGALQWSPLKLDSGAHFAFVHYREAAPGVEVFGDPASPDLDGLALALRLPPSLFERVGE